MQPSAHVLQTSYRNHNSPGGVRSYPGIEIDTGSSSEGLSRNPDLSTRANMASNSSEPLPPPGRRGDCSLVMSTMMKGTPFFSLMRKIGGRGKRKLGKAGEERLEGDRKVRRSGCWVVASLRHLTHPPCTNEEEDSIVVLCRHAVNQ